VATVVILLDPLPVLQDEMTGAPAALQNLGVFQPEPDVRNEEAGAIVHGTSSRPFLRTRTRVRSRSEASANFVIRALRYLRALKLGKDEPRQGDSDSNPAAASMIYQSHIQDPESGQQGRREAARAMTGTHFSASGGMTHFFARLTGNASRPTEDVDRSVAAQLRSGTKKTTIDPLFRSMFEDPVPRGPAADYELMMSLENTDRLRELVSDTSSTASALGKWILHEQTGKRSALLCRDPSERFFHLIQLDTMNVVHLMHQKLREIGQHILGDTLIQQRLVRWRHTLERFDIELQYLEDSLGRFAKFINAFETPDKPVSDKGDDPLSIEALRKDRSAQIYALRYRTTKSYKSLMANMSIVENKRGIAEAEGVTILTELEFFFIPLTFSASIFSMQVKEISSATVSLSAFFFLAVISTVSSYALRLFIRSASAISFHQRSVRDIRADANLPAGAPVPTVSFLIWPLVSRWTSDHRRRVFSRGPSGACRAPVDSRYEPRLPSSYHGHTSDIDTCYGVYRGIRNAFY